MMEKFAEKVYIFRSLRGGKNKKEDVQEEALEEQGKTESEKEKRVHR